MKMAIFANILAFSIWLQFFPHTSPLSLNHSEVVWEIDNFMSSNTSSITPPSSLNLNSFPLYNLDIFMKKHYKDYKSLVLARLRHDERRSRHIASALSVHGNNSYSMSKYRTVSTMEEGAGYIAIFGIGSETKLMNLLLDTGSAFVRWQCQASCEECFDDVYDSSRSSTYLEVDCSSEKCDHDIDYIFDCGDNANERCQYRIVSDEGAEYEGVLATETITTFDNELANNITFGCANDNEYFPRFYSGTLSFGQGRYSYATQVGATKFSFCLGSYTSDSTTSILLHELPVADKSTIVIPILENPRAPSFYYVGLMEIRIGNDAIPISPEEWKFDSEGRGGILIDTASVVTRFPEDMYSIFRDKFEEEFGGLQHLPGEGVMDTCYNSTSQEWLSDVPSVEFYFDTNSKTRLRLDVKQILMPIGRHGKYCLAFGSLSSESSWRHSILATWQLQSTTLSFDLSARTLSITPRSCS